MPRRSASQEFIVYGTSRDLVAYVVERADTMEGLWKRLFRLPPVSQKPIIIRLVERALLSPDRTPFQISLFISDDDSLKVQLDVFDGGEVRSLEFDRKIFQSLALRDAYASSPPAPGSRYHQPPDWILDAAVQNLLDTEEGNSSRAYAAALIVAQDLDLRAFLTERPVDTVSRAIYRVKALSLVQSLIELPGGRAGMRRLLLRPHLWDGTSSALLSCFPGLRGDANALVKIWMLNLARPTGVQKMSPLRMGETSQRLNAILSISLPDGENALKDKMVSGPEAIPLIAAMPRYKYLLRSRAQDLLLLSFRAHPMYRALTDEYRGIIETLLRSPRKNLDARIQEADRLREALAQRCMDIEDYLNWFEAVCLTDASNPFRSILENDQRRQVHPWRSDAISRAMDAIEVEGW